MLEIWVVRAEWQGVIIAAAFSVRVTLKIVSEVGKGLPLHTPTGIMYIIIAVLFVALFITLPIMDGQIKYLCIATCCIAGEALD